VLLVEDNPVNREVADELLRAGGLRVDAAEQGAQAVELALERQYDLILMDVQMPVLDGLEATRAIRDGGSHVPIVAMTANAFNEDRAACLAAGMNDHLAKPVDPATLYATLQRWLPQRSAPALAGTPESAPLGTAPEPRRPLVERLAKVDGMDIAAGLRNVGQQPAILVRVLQQFVSTYQNDLAVLDRASSALERAQSAAACHSLRGACAAVGATALAESLKSFEAALASPDDVAALAQRGARLQVDLLALVSRLAAELT
jgi:CheY-like chemotaxis protein/HPt (histidine-containing phosphotransfer) domain-containing protein